MKFTDGYWHLRPGVTAAYAHEAYAIEADGDEVVITAPSKAVVARGNVLNLPVLTVTLSAPAEGVVKVRLEHHVGGRRSPGFPLREGDGAGRVSIDEQSATLTSGSLRAVVRQRVGLHGAVWTVVRLLLCLGPELRRHLRRRLPRQLHVGEQLPSGLRRRLPVQLPGRQRLHRHRW